jgi:hypothetical protein
MKDEDGADKRERIKIKGKKTENPFG